MKRKLLFSSVSAFLVLVAGSALADTYSGTITKLNRSSELLEVRGDEHGRRQTFLLSRKGQVTRDGQAVAFDDLKRGDHVKIDFTRKGSTHTAYSVAVAADEATETVATRESARLEHPRTAGAGPVRSTGRPRVC